MKKRNKKFKNRKINIESSINKIIHGHNIKVMRRWKKNSVDTIITDPQYGLGFMGKEWDKILPNPKTWKECLRIAKPGAFMLCFGGTRTYHRVTCAIEDAGWEIRDCLMWLYGSGFPKSLDISKAIDKAKGKKRKIVGKKGGRYSYGFSDSANEPLGKGSRIIKGGYLGGHEFETAPTSKLAKLWDGYGTALKPAWEPIVIAMKPVDGNFAKNAEKYGVAGLNIDGGRIGTEQIKLNIGGSSGSGRYGYNKGEKIAWKKKSKMSQGRWPANLILDEEAAAMLDKQSGINKSGKVISSKKGYSGNSITSFLRGISNENNQHGDSGGASRFFYTAKASRGERNSGCGGMEKKYWSDGRKVKRECPHQRYDIARQNFHPTVKPLSLMKYLCLLLKMPGKDQIILDPFVGSGTTCIACKELGINYIGIEKDKGYCEIAKARLRSVRPNIFAEDKPKRKTKKKKSKRTLGIFE